MCDEPEVAPLNESAGVPIDEYEVTCHRFDTWQAERGWQKTLTWEIHGGGKHAYGEVSGYDYRTVNAEYTYAVYQVLGHLGADRPSWDAFRMTRFVMVL